MSASEDIETFCNITGASEAQAKFYMESAKGDVNAAVAAYLENDSEDADTSMPGAYVQDEPLASGSSTTGTSSATASKGKTKGAQNSGINTLQGLNDRSSDEFGDDQPAEFYTGGEKSGLGVIDPNKRKNGSDRTSNLIQDLLKKAAAGGQQSETQTTDSTFRGSGYTLGGEDEESRKVEDPNEAFRRAMASQPPKVTRVLKLWKDGFSVDDGNLYRYDDPANKGYLEAINKGHAPLALLNVAYGQAVDVTVEKRTDAVYSPPPKVFKAFETSGHRLGNEQPPTAQPTAPTASRNTSSTTIREPSMIVDESQPVTELQIRFASGTRVVSRFNHTHTLTDVYDFVDLQPQTAGRSYQLLSPFPRKEFSRGDTTIEEAGLLKGVLQQKFT